MSTTQVAKNSFQEGLIMDFAPSTTQANCMTSALNATLLTFNGNEMSLQNDMGNARVETARLPDGYIPVGTCEFGDIIYIVSYNPLTNKSQIGCFPSPERNIDTKEQGLPGQTIQASDFQVFNNNKPTGDLKTMSKKVILTNALSPGDKYAIHATNNTNDRPIHEEKLSGVGAGTIDEFPQLLKVSVVSFEEDGKIKYLDSSVKWYDDIGYFILNNVGDENSIPDIDTYRNILQSGYSIFQSKVSGKLGLYFELEAITSFSCSHDLVLLGEVDPVEMENGLPSQTQEDIVYKQYAINMDLNWTNNNKFVNPSYIILDDVYLENIPTDDASEPIFRHVTVNNIATTLSLDPIIKGIALNNKYTLGETSYSRYRTLKVFYERDNRLCLDDQDIPYYWSISDIKHEKVFIDNIYKKNLADRYYIQQGNKKMDVTDIVKDDEIVNYLNKSIYKDFGTILIPYKNEDLNIKNDIKLHYSLTPAMPYGKLPQYTQKGVIEFGKIGTGYVGITDWKYYNTDTLSTLTFGLDVYPEPNHYVERVVLCFYDNDGFAGAYKIENKSSYSGKFTEIIPLNNSVPNYKLVNNYSDNYCISSEKNIEEGEFVKIIKPENEFREMYEKYISDLVIYNNRYIKTEVYKELRSQLGPGVSGALEEIEIADEIHVCYYNSVNAEIKLNKLYLVKIVVEDVFSLEKSQKSSKIIKRWFWSNSMFNDHYYNISDFTILKPTLQFDCDAYYYADNLYPEQIELPRDSSRQAEVIKQEILNKPIQTSLQVGFQNNFNTFSLYHPKEGGNYVLSQIVNENSVPVAGALNDIKITVNVPDKSIITYPDVIDYKNFNGIKNTDCNLLPEKQDVYNENNESTYDQFKLEINASDVVPSEQNKDYLSSDQEYLEKQPTKYVDLFLKDLYFISEEEHEPIQLNVTLQNYNYHTVVRDLVTKQLPALKPLVYKKEDLEAYNLCYNENTKHFYIKDLYLIAGQYRWGDVAHVRPCSIDQGSGIININYDNKRYTWSIGGWYGHKHQNIIGKDADLLRRTKDGFYLWAIDYYEQNNFDGGHWSEIAVVADNNFEGDNPESKRIWFTNPSRLVNFPIDGDLRCDWRIYNSDNHKTYKSLFKDEYSTYVGSTTYAEGFATSTMFGLALVYKGTWYTLNNIFNFKVNTPEGELEISKTLTQEIQYSGNQYYIPNTVTYYINDMGDDFAFINQTKDIQFSRSNEQVGPGYLSVEKKENQWQVLIPFSTKINYKGNLYHAEIGSGVVLNKNSWFSANLTTAFNWQWSNEILSGDNQLMSRYKEDGKWKPSTKLIFKALSNKYEIDINVTRNSVPLNIFKSYFNSKGIYFYERGTITLSDNTTTTGLIKYTILYNSTPNRGRCNKDTYKLVKEFSLSCDYYIVNSDGTLSEQPAIYNPEYEYKQYHHDFTAMGWNLLGFRDDLYRCVMYDSARQGYYVVNNLGAYTDEPASGNVVNATIDYAYNVILPKEGTGLYYQVTSTGILDIDSEPIEYSSTLEALYDSEYDVVMVGEDGNYYKVCTSDNAILNDKSPGDITTNPAQFYMYDQNTACAVVFPQNLTFVQTIDDFDNAKGTYIYESLSWTDVDGNIITDYVYEIDKKATYQFQFNEENSQYNLYGYVGNETEEFKAENQVIIPFSINQNENTTYAVPTLKENLPITPGDALVGLLNSIYIKVNNYTQDNLVPVDTLYTDYTTKYIKDVFYEVSVKDNTRFEDLLQINNVPWNTYMADLANHVNYDDNQPNVQITINPCKKTIPIELDISAPKIYESYSNEGNCYIIRDNVVKLATLNLEDDAMYYLNSQNVPRFLTQQTIAVSSKPVLIKNEEDGSEYITSISTERNNDVNNSFTVDNLYKAFKIEEGYLTLKEDYHINEDMFQITLDDMGSYCTAIRDIPLKASLFSGTEILTTLDHVEA